MTTKLVFFARGQVRRKRLGRNHSIKYAPRLEVGVKGEDHMDLLPSKLLVVLLTEKGMGLGLRDRGWCWLPTLSPFSLVGKPRRGSNKDSWTIDLSSHNNPQIRKFPRPAQGST